MDAVIAYCTLTIICFVRSGILIEVEASTLRADGCVIYCLVAATALFNALRFYIYKEGLELGLSNLIESMEIFRTAVHRRYLNKDLEVNA